MEGQKSLSVCCVEKKNIMDGVGHEAARHPKKIHRKGDGKVTEKETAREPRRVASPKEEKAETKGKEKVEERKGNVSRKSQNFQKSSGNNGQIILVCCSRHYELAGR